MTGSERLKQTSRTQSQLQSQRLPKTERSVGKCGSRRRDHDHMAMAVGSDWLGVDPQLNSKMVLEHADGHKIRHRWDRANVPIPNDHDRRMRLVPANRPESEHELRRSDPSTPAKLSGVSG